MKIKPRIIRGLLGLYPAGWRAEYGEELAALLLNRAITASTIVDVVASATGERLKRDQVWKICGICLFAWTAFGVLLNNTAPLSNESYEWYKKLWQLGVLLAACLTVSRSRGASPTWAAVKAALLGSLPETVALMLWAAGVFHPLVTRAAGPYRLVESRLALFDMTFPTVPRPGFDMLPIEIGWIMAQACVLGFVGGLLGRLISFFSTRIHLC
jgi:hypothetical protein